MASEELKQRGGAGVPFGAFEYFDLGNTSLAACARENIISRTCLKAAGDGRKKPDGLLVDRRDPKNPVVIAVVEWKDGLNQGSSRLTDGTLEHSISVRKAMGQAAEYGAILGAKFCVATDGQNSHWFLPARPGKPIDALLDEHGARIEYPWEQVPRTFNPDDTKESTRRQWVERICQQLQGNKLVPGAYLDPSSLARSVWQLLYVGAGTASPERALAAFVELFMFKFLSDLGVLGKNNKGVDISFHGVLNTHPDACLRLYCEETRTTLREMFPPSDHDGTTLINGFALRPDNPDHGKLFHQVLRKFQEFQDDNDGRTLRDINWEFKSRLYEEFLKGSVGQKSQGQFFTPRKVMRAIVEMSGADRLPDGASVCDPACGVGGFLLETSAYRQNNGIGDYALTTAGMKRKIHYHGYEKEPTNPENEHGKLALILAKSNFVIYQSDLLAKHPHATKAFAETFNDVFKMQRAREGGSLGSLRVIEQEAHDLILSNPPYVASGTSALKKIAAGYGIGYTTNGVGLEGMFLEKIVRELKPRGRAFVILPDGTFTRTGDNNLRAFVAKHCHIDGIVALPGKTFFATDKKTYILCLTKKLNEADRQHHPVFSYLVSNIGETLNSDRLKSDLNDLPGMVNLFRQFMAIKKEFSVADPRCRFVAVENFLRTGAENVSWAVERFWSNDELLALGYMKSKGATVTNSWTDHLKDLAERFTKMASEYQKIPPAPQVATKPFPFHDLFDMARGSAKWTRKYAADHKGQYPLYTAATKNVQPDKVDAFAFDAECLLMTTNGTNAGTVFHIAESKFSVNSDAAVLTTKEAYSKNTCYAYLRFAMAKALAEFNFDWENKPSIKKLAGVMVELPVDAAGVPDLQAQQAIATNLLAIEKQSSEVGDLVASLSNIRYL